MNTREFINQYRDNLSTEERERRWAEQAEMLTRDAVPLVEALTAAGWPAGVEQCGPVRSVWDLVNTAVSYPQLLDTLADHVTRPYHPRTKEGIARALAVREARGTRIPRVLMDELKKQTDPSQGPNSYRWVLINTLVLIGDSSMTQEVRQLLQDSRYSTVHEHLQRLEGALSKRSPGDRKRDRSKCWRV